MKTLLFIAVVCILPAVGLSDDLAPADTAAKLRYHAESAYGPAALLGAAAYDGVLQAADAPREWGQGLQGYGKRYASTLAYAGLRNVLAFGLDAPLHQDPRYARSHQTGFWNRTGHAMRGIVLTRKDSGGETFATWRFGSAYGAAFISNEWYPDRLNTVKLGLAQGTVQLGWDLLANLGSEFWPDVKRKLRHH